MGQRTPYDSSQDEPRVPGYQFLGEVARDGKSVVYKAIQASSGKTVAVHLASAGQSTNRGFREELTRQARELTSLDRSSPVCIIEHGTLQDNREFIVTEYYQERSSDELVEEVLQEDESSQAGHTARQEIGTSGLNTDLPDDVRAGGPTLAETLLHQLTRHYFPDDGGGVLCVAGTDVPLEEVLIAHQQGSSPEQIQRRFPELRLAQVYGTIAYYLGHRPEIDLYLERRQLSQTQGPSGSVQDRHGGFDQTYQADADVTAPPSKFDNCSAAAGQISARELGGNDAADASAQQTVAPSAPIGAEELDVTAPPSTADSAATVPPSKPPAREGSDGAAATPSGMTPPSNDPTLRQIETARKLGPYEIVGRLGQGAMGAVYLARQISLDRKVAVKVLNSRLSDDASFVARFTREAYAAAQLTHHNIVQIHDIGEQDYVHYFSMEFVEGQTLNGLLKSGGRVEPARAVNYILQAARGLKFAHDHSMIHRDIKPHNLMLNEQGLVKVVDLGLVKRKGVLDDQTSLLTLASDASMTGAASAMGTPAYMAPEQAKDAASVDARADIYSLGCALYDLLTGRPPFTGATAVEVITKHATAPVTPPDKIVGGVPKSLSAILLKMMAKKPEDRHASMDEVIEALEGYLATTRGGVAGPFVPEAHHVRGVELSLTQFNSVSWDYVRKVAIWMYFGIGVVGLLATIWGSHLKGLAKELWGMHVKIAEGVFGLMTLTFLCYVVISGFSQRAYLTGQLRQYVSGVRVFGWIKAGLAAVVVAGLLSALHLHWVWLLCLAVSFCIALAFHGTVDRALKKERRNSLMQLETLLKTLRQQGMDEDALRLFVCEQSGARWEEVYASLFGYDSQISPKLRRKLAERGLGRRKWTALGNPIINVIDAEMRRGEEERRAQYFARIEERKFLAQGMEAEEAKARAKKIARDLVAKARRLKDAMDDSRVEPAGQGKANPLLIDEPGEGENLEAKGNHNLQRALAGIAGSVLGPQVRLVAGLVMLAIFVLWLRVDYPTLPSLIVEKARVIVHPSALAKAVSHSNGTSEVDKSHAPLTAETLTVKSANDAAVRFTHISNRTREHVATVENRVFRIVGSWQGGLAGALLVLSSLFPRLRVGLVMVASTLLILVVGRYLMVPTHGVIRTELAGAVLGTMVAFGGFLFGRERRWRRQRRLTHER